MYFPFIYFKNEVRPQLRTIVRASTPLPHRPPQPPRAEPRVRNAQNTPWTIHCNQFRYLENNFKLIGTISVSYGCESVYIQAKMNYNWAVILFLSGNSEG